MTVLLPSHPIVRRVAIFGLAVASYLAMQSRAFSSSFLGSTQTVEESATAVFGTYPFPARWFHDGKLVAGANTARLEIEHARLADAGVYRVEHLDSTYRETFTLNVFTPPPSRVDRSFSASSVKGYARGFDAAGNILFASDLVPVPGGTNSTWLRPDGTLLSEFVYPLAAGRILAICPDGSLVTARAPYRLGRDGAPLAFTLPSTFSGTELSVAAALSDGRFLCAQGKRLTRFLADGTVDPLFTAELVDNVDILTLTVDVQQRVLVFGSTRGGTRVYRMLESGAVDSTYAIARYSSGGESVTIFPLRDGRYVLVSSWGGGGRELGRALRL